MDDLHELSASERRAIHILGAVLRNACPACGAEERRLCIGLDRVEVVHTARAALLYDHSFVWKAKPRFRRTNWHECVSITTGQAVTVEKRHDYSYGKSLSKWRRRIERHLPPDEETW